MDLPVKPLILFDGVCNLCNGAVKFTIKRDPSGKIMFAPLQSETGKKLLAKFNLPENDYESFVFIEDGKAYQKSTAALHVLRYLRGGWPLMYAFIIVPPFIRNGIYSLIANNRYKLFGRQESCMVPTPEIKKRFLN